MSFNDLPDFLSSLANVGQLKRITCPVKAHLELTEISRRVLKMGGPALLFEHVIKDDGTKSLFPVVTNLYGHLERIKMALKLTASDDFRDLGKLLTTFRQPEVPSSFKHALLLLPHLKRVLAMTPKTVLKAPCQQIVTTRPDLTLLPIQTCWPEDAGPLITWPLVVTKGPSNSKIDDYNLGIYRLQPVAKDKLLIRWLKMRGGEQQHQRWQQAKFAPFPAAAVIGASPSVTIAAVMPLPDNISEYNFAGFLNQRKIELVKCKTIDLKVPASAEIVLEGEVSFSEYLPEGPFGDHTGYYNDISYFPVFNIKAITMKKHPLYLSTYTGKPPDEPAILGEALNEIFIPIIQQQFPEIVDFWLPPEGCSYRIAVISIKKSYAGQAKRIMLGIWSYLRQFTYTKLVIVVDDDINARDWKEVMWAIATRSDPRRDTTFIDNAPIDYLDFASTVSGLGSKAGIDATNKIPPETNRNWGKKIVMTQEVIDRIDNIWHDLGLE